MGRGDAQLASAKQSYRKAKEVGNRQEEARWANVIGDILKNRGEYVEALKWVRIDYDLSVRYLPQKQVLPSCQSLGELYLRLQNFKDALIYQKKHLELAKDVDDLVEQQRAATQLGRTYHEMFTDNATVDDHYYLRNAKKYFKIAMKLAQKLKECPPDHGSSFIKEYVDAHNNIGMLEIDIDNLEGAERILIEGLNICDEEEVNENDDARSRLHHNLGNVYLELREWDKARVHIEKDIIICKEIGHCQGEAKGYINLGELHYRVQRYEEAIRCYRKALDLANSMEDEDALVSQIEANIETTRTAMKVMDEIKKEEQELKKLNRNISSSRGTSRERKCLMQHMSLLDSLIDKSSMLLAWLKHLEFAKQKKRITIELYDKEKVGDSFLALGESYWKLREFNKAIKWYTKGWETCKAITNLEGQAMAKINIGNVLDSSGDRKGALSSYEEAYRVAVEANLPDFQIQALENMHYIQMIRFDNTDEARRLRRKIEDLKATKEREVARAKVVADCCSETDSEDSSLNKSNTSSPKISKSSFTKSKSFEMAEGSSDDDEPLISLRSRKQPHRKTTHVESQNIFNIPTDASPRRMSESRSLQTVSRKRVRVILSGSDDEDDADNSMSCSKMRSQGCVVEDATASNKRADNGKHVAVNSPKIGQDVSVVSSKCANSSRKLDSNEESSCSFKLKDHEEQCITFKIDDDLIHIKADFYHETGNMSIESVKVELACLYYLRLPEERRSKGLLPIIQHLYFSGKVLQSLEEFEDLKDDVERNVIDVSVSGWVQKRLMKLYIDCCKEILEAPNMKLLKRLYISEVEDEVVASECELQDISATPLLNALHIHKSVATLDISHNLLGNGTMEKLQHLFQSGPKYGDLTLNLHCNRFGPNALFQASIMSLMVDHKQGLGRQTTAICECPILFTRLEVLNISGNRLTDSCGSYLSTIVEQCTALYSLSIEQCSITSRTIQKMANALHAGSNLGRLNIGYNDPISGQSVIHLLSKLSILKSFDELNMNGIKLNKSAVDALSELARTKGLSHLMVASSGVGLDGALQLTEAMLSGSPESVKMNLSYCGVTPAYIHKLNTTLFCGIIELNLGGNPLLREDACGLASFLMNPQCSIKVLVLDKCKLGCTGILEVIRALAGNLHLEEIYLAENVEVDTQPTQQHQDVTQPCMKISNILPNKKVDIMDMQDASAINNDRNQLEVADSEEATAMEGASDFDDACTSLRPRNSTLDAQCIDELSNAIGMAKHLQLLDLSRNGFSTQVAETLYNAWSIRSEAGVAHKHIKDQIIHLSVETNKCCRIKPCCKRN